jgi:hypothetical protein
MQAQTRNVYLHSIHYCRPGLSSSLVAWLLLLLLLLVLLLRSWPPLLILLLRHTSLLDTLLLLWLLLLLLLLLPLLLLCPIGSGLRFHKRKKGALGGLLVVLPFSLTSLTALLAATAATCPTPTPLAHPLNLTLTRTAHAPCTPSACARLCAGARYTHKATVAALVQESATGLRGNL